MKHNKSSLANQEVTIKKGVKHPQNDHFGGSKILIEDWWDRIYGSSWMFAQENPACLVYAVRTAFSKEPIPSDDEVLYGHTKDGLGHLVHISEIEED